MQRNSLELPQTLLKFVLLKKLFNIDTEICGAFAEARVFELLKDSVYTLRDDEVPLDELFKFLNKL